MEDVTLTLVLVVIHIESNNNEARTGRQADIAALIGKKTQDTESKIMGQLDWPRSQRDKQQTTSLVAIVSDNEEEDANKGT